MYGGDIMIVRDETANTFVHIDLPNYRVRDLIEEYEGLDSYEVKGVTMDFTQFLIWEDQADINPDLVTEVAEGMVREVRTDR